MPDFSLPRIPQALVQRGFQRFSSRKSPTRLPEDPPYGLSDHKIQLLHDAGYRTVGDLIDAPDDDLDDVYGIGEVTLLRIRNVLGQAIWM